MTENDEILFISDLHLSQDKPEITENFLDFLQTRAIRARVLYILGDLFEVWLGDDDPASEFKSVFKVLSHCAKTTEIIFIHGNRDFLLGNKAASRMGFNLVEEPVLLQLDGQKIALIHGDILCTDDVDYQRFRQQVRSDEWQHEFLSKSLLERQNIARELREKSSAAMQHKSIDIMDVNQQAVEQYFNSLNIDTLIHGHTHRPAMHQLENQKTRIVLGDWNPGPSYLSWKNNQFSLVDHRL